MQNDLISKSEAIELLQKNMSNDISDRIITENNINLLMSLPCAYDVEQAKTPTPIHPIPLDTQMYIQELESRFERIVEELEEAKEHYRVEWNKHLDDEDYGNLSAYEDAIKIVKGGVDNAE